AWPTGRLRGSCRSRASRRRRGGRSPPAERTRSRPRPSCRASGRQQESELAQGALVAAPVPAHFHGRLEIYLDAEERLEVAPGGRADLLQHRAPLADEDALLRLLLDEYGRPDVEAGGLLPLRALFHPDRGRRP